MSTHFEGWKVGEKSFKCKFMRKNKVFKVPMNTQGEERVKWTENQVFNHLKKSIQPISRSQGIEADVADGNHHKSSMFSSHMWVSVYWKYFFLPSYLLHQGNSLFFLIFMML